MSIIPYLPILLQNCLVLYAPSPSYKKVKNIFKKINNIFQFFPESIQMIVNIILSFGYKNNKNNLQEKVLKFLENFLNNHKLKFFFLKFITFM